MSSPSCTACGSADVRSGFIEDRGQGSSGYGRWITGPLKTGVFGGAKKFGQVGSPVTGFRCDACGHLDLYTAAEGDADDY